MCFALQAAVTKVFVPLVGYGLSSLLTSWTTYALIASALLGFVFQQSALKTGVLAPAMASSNAVTLFASIVFGTTVFGEALSRVEGVGPGSHRFGHGARRHRPVGRGQAAGGSGPSPAATPFGEMARRPPRKLQDWTNVLDAGVRPSRAAKGPSRCLTRARNATMASRAVGKKWAGSIVLVSP